MCKVAVGLLEVLLGDDSSSMYLTDVVLEGEREFDETYRPQIKQCVASLAAESYRVLLVSKALA